MNFFHLLSLFICISGCFSYKTLVLLETLTTRETHSMFFQSLRDRGHDLTFKMADDSSLVINKFGEYLYENIVIFAPSVREFGGKVDVQKLTQYLDDGGGNILVAANEKIGEAIRDFGSECGVEFDEEKTNVIDHFNFDKILDGAGKHTAIILDPHKNVPAKVSVITGKPQKPILYRGIGIAADENNPLLINLLHASSTAYTYNPDKQIEDYPNTVGINTQLVTGIQARNNVRAVFAGSLDFFSNAYFKASVQNGFGKDDRIQDTSNAEYCEALSKWVFKETGVLRAGNVTHYLKNTQEKNPREYTILDKVRYEITIEELQPDGTWAPYDGRDVQLEFVRIDPFVRSNLLRAGDKFYLDFVLPDVYGVFKFLVDYHRVGYTHLFSSNQVSVRPLKHTEYERFIESAYPYYASAISMMVGVFIFSFVYLYFRDDKEKSE